MKIIISTNKEAQQKRNMNKITQRVMIKLLRTSDKGKYGPCYSMLGNSKKLHPYFSWVLKLYMSATS